MIAEYEKIITSIFFLSSVSGCAGGVAMFVLGLKKGHYKNNKYITKLIIEIVGATLTASFITVFISSNTYKFGAAFLIGAAWANILQITREKITTIVEVALGEKLSGDHK